MSALNDALFPLTSLLYDPNYSDLFSVLKMRLQAAESRTAADGCFHSAQSTTARRILQTQEPMEIEEDQATSRGT